MELRDFLRRVCSDKDEVVITQLDNKKGIFWNRESFTYNKFDAAQEKITKWDAQQDSTIYFSVGSFADHTYVDENGRTKMSRTQEKATYFKSICFDLDCGEDKPYKTQQDGLVALVEVVKELKLPKPMIVSSGNGAHVYWVLDKSIDKELWVMVSQKLRKAFEDKNLVIDSSKIHDPSMVLRPVGTHHKKSLPWKPVEVILDDGKVHDVALILGLLSKYEVPLTPLKKTRKKSAMLDAILDEGKDVDIFSVANHCNQVHALIESGGVTNANGDPVEEPLWRASLGIAKFTPDPEIAILSLAGEHPDFDLDMNLDKIAGWKGTGPTTCATFEQLCPKGCDGCPYKGKKTSPAQLSERVEMVIEEPIIDETGEQEVVETKIALPEGYSVKSGWIYRQIETEVDGTVVKDWELVSKYLMHVKGIFYDKVDNKTAFTLVVKYPIVGWVEQDHDVGVLSASGKDFSSFLLNTQIMGCKTASQQEKIRGFLMDYLEMVQAQSSTGYDYSSFGWQEDGSFICGSSVINAPHNNTNRRITGNANRMSSLIKPVGSREKYIEAMDFLNTPSARVIKTAVLLACTGVIAKEMGNGSSTISIYSTTTSTGKTLTLLAANALFGHPRQLIRGRNDTPNSLYGLRGVMNNLPMCIDELTLADDKQLAQMAYSFSEGQDKLSMNSNRELREPPRWDGPTIMTTNSSLMGKYEQVLGDSEPLRVRTFEIANNDRTFVELTKDGDKVAKQFGELLTENYGWAMPELVEAVCALGGPKAVAQGANKDFKRVFGFEFSAQERFYESMIKSAWGMGKIGNKLGLFPFDIKETIEFMLEIVKKLRKDTQDARTDALDVIGQFMQEHNDKIIQVIQEYGAKTKPQVQYPTPDKATMRLHIMYDDNNPIMPGSQLAINRSAFKKFLKDNNDAEDRILDDLANMGALLDPNNRVTMYKNCAGKNPAQAWCIMVNINHPRFVEAMKDTKIKQQSPVSLALLEGLTGESNGNS